MSDQLSSLLSILPSSLIPFPLPFVLHPLHPTPAGTARPKLNAFLSTQGHTGIRARDERSLLHKILPRTHPQILVSAGRLPGHGNLSIIKE